MAASHAATSDRRRSNTSSVRENVKSRSKATSMSMSRIANAGEPEIQAHTHTVRIHTHSLQYTDRNATQPPSVRTICHTSTVYSPRTEMPHNHLSVRTICHTATVYRQKCHTTTFCTYNLPHSHSLQPTDKMPHNHLLYVQSATQPQSTIYGQKCHTTTFCTYNLSHNHTL